MSATKSTSPSLRLRLTAAAESIVRGGHPWVFADSVREQNRAGEVGELAVIYDRKDKFLAVGFYDPTSPIRVRVLHAGKPVKVDDDFWRLRLETAVRRRDGLFDEHTTGCRLINGESDGWPGLVLDRYDTTLVLKIYTAAWLGRLPQVAKVVWERLKPEQVVLRTSRNIRQGTVDRLVPPPHKPRSSGRASAPSEFEEKSEPAHVGGSGSRVQSAQQLLGNSHPGPLPPGEGESSAAGMRIGVDGEILPQARGGSETGTPVVFIETGLRFEADVWRGQKTGFFLDQRENRRIVETLARGRIVLNACSFSGGFSLYAARGGAESVTDLDVSKHALESAKRNFALNASDTTIAACRHESVQADAFAWLAGNAKRKFDLIVLDPPSLAKRESERAGAIRAYGQLVESGIRHLSPGGVLLACSCSAHVSADEFFGAVRQAATRSGRQVAELRTTRHAPDHPATFAEAEYLKGIYLRF